MTRILLASALILSLAAPAFAATPESATTTATHHGAMFERHSEPGEGNYRPKVNDPYWTKCDYFSYNDVNGCE